MTRTPRHAWPALAICVGGCLSSVHAGPLDLPPVDPFVLASSELTLSLSPNDGEQQAASDPHGDEERWEFELTPVLWAASMSGSGTIKGRSFDAGVSFGEVFSNLDFGGMFVGGAKKGRFGIKFGGMYVKMSQEVRQGPLRPNLDTKLAIAQLYASYELASIPLGSAKDSGHQSTLGIDVYGGARYTYFSGRLSLQGPLGVKVEQSQDWVDPVIGGSLRFHLGEKWRIAVQGDVGGFGVGSDLVWSVTARIDYHFTPNISIMGGYHLIDYDFDGALKLDAQLRGPFLGVAFRF